MGFRKKIYVRKSNKGITHGIKKTVKHAVCLENI